MSYLFDPDNWEWLWTANNAQFLLEAFLINLEIALISMVLALVARPAARAAVAHAVGAGADRLASSGSTSSATCR